MKHTQNITYCLSRLLMCIIVVLFSNDFSLKAEIALRHSAVNVIFPDSMDVANGNKKHFWRASAEVVGFNLGLWAFDRYVQHGDWSYINIHTIKRNFREGFKWDNDNLGTNTFLHPYNGNLYFNAGRSNGFNFWQSELFAIGGSAMWEMFMENEYPSTNDIIATPIGGAVLGETLYRASDAVLDDRLTGWNRFGREAACFVLNPMRGITRIVSGQSWRKSATPGRVFGTPDISLRLSAGARMLETQGRFKELKAGPCFQIDLEYGDRFESRTHRPYDYFTVRAEIQAMASQPVISQINIKGRLLSCALREKPNQMLSLGMYQHFNFYDSDTIDNSGRVPYKLGIPACLGGGLIYRQLDSAGRWQIDASLHTNAIALGSILSDHYFTDERNYNWASGFSIQAAFNWIFNHRNMALSISHNFYRLFTWSGYRQGTNLRSVDFRTLNVQGDKSVSSFNVTEARFDFRIYKQLFGTVAFSNYVRSTNYRDFPFVLSSAQALRLMVSYKL